MANNFEKRVMNATPVKGGLDMLRSHCETLNSYNWVRASGKRYVIAKGEDGKHYLDFRLVKDA